MEDAWLIITAYSLLKNAEAWDANIQIEPSYWEEDPHQTAACLAQQLLADRDSEKYRRLRCQAARKRSFYKNKK